MQKIDPASRGHFPAGDPGRQLDTLPFAKLLGIRWEGWGDAGVRMRLPWSPRVSRTDRPAIDAGALIALVDQTCSAAGYRALDQPRLIATLDLRVDFADPPADRADAICDARAEWRDDDWAFVRAHCRSARDGTLLAIATSTYSLGTHPGGPLREQLTPALIEAWQAASRLEHEPASLDRTLGFRRVGQGGVVAFRRELVGAITLPAWHGGAIAAALARTVWPTTDEGDQPADCLGIAIQYLRAARDEALELSTTVIRQGGRVSIHEIDAFQGSQRIARATCSVRGRRNDAARRKETE